MESNVEMAPSKLQETFMGNFDPKMKYILAVQGCSTSGKSTFSSCLQKVISLNSKKCKAFVFSTDCFYKSDPDWCSKTEKFYDYDNPAALDWDLMFECLLSLIKNDPIFKYSKYDFKNCVREDISVVNDGFNVIIVEGIFAHNLLSKDTLNYNFFDPTNTFKEILEDEKFIENQYFQIFSKNAKIIPIHLDLNDNTIIKNRILIDSIRTGKSAEESEKYTRKFVLRSTQQLVRRTCIPNSIYINRDYDEEYASVIIQTIADFFGIKEELCLVKQVILETISQISC